MLRLFEPHREAEAARDIDGILDTFVDDCFLETVPLGLRNQGRDAVRRRTRRSSSQLSPIWRPRTRAWRSVTTSLPCGERCAERAAESGSEPPGGGTFVVPSTNLVPFRDGLMEGERVYFDLATLCEQAGISLESVPEAAKAMEHGGGGART